MLNWKIWPDFSQLELPSSANCAIEFVEIEYGDTIEVDDVSLTANLGKSYSGLLWIYHKRE